MPDVPRQKLPLYMRILNALATPFVAAAEFWNSHVQGKQPWKWWQR